MKEYYPSPSLFVWGVFFDVFYFFCFNRFLHSPYTFENFVVLCGLIFIILVLSFGVISLIKRKIVYRIDDEKFEAQGVGFLGQRVRKIFWKDVGYIGSLDMWLWGGFLNIYEKSGKRAVIVQLYFNPIEMYDQIFQHVPPGTVIDIPFWLRWKLERWRKRQKNKLVQTSK